MTTTTRVPPHDLDAEESLLGAMMLSREAQRAAADAGVTSVDFYKPKHSAIFTAIEAVTAADAFADPVTVASQLNGQLELVGGRRELVRIQGATPASANASFYADVVRNCADRRRLMVASTELDRIALEGADPSRILEQIRTLTLRLADDATQNETWAAVDLTDALNGTIHRTLPAIGERTDGQALFYPGRVNGIHGDSGLGKTMLTNYTAAQQLHAGHHIGVIDLEEPDPTVIIERLRMFDVDDQTIANQLHYYCPREPFTDPVIAEIANLAHTDQWTLIVIDSLGEAFGLEGINEDKDVEVGPWLRRVARVLADAGPAIVIVDHATKANDNPLHPSGSKRKRAVITGASYLVEAPVALTRDRGGQLKITCAKDRHGNYQRGREVATLELTTEPKTATLRAPERDQPTEPWAGPTHCIEAVTQLLASIAPTALGSGAVAKALRERGQSFRTQTITTSLRQAAETGALIVESGPRGALLYHHPNSDIQDEIF